MMSWILYTSRLFAQVCICALTVWIVFTNLCQINHKGKHEVDQQGSILRRIDVNANEFSWHTFSDDDIPKDPLTLPKRSWLIMDSDAGVLYVFPKEQHIGHHFIPFQSRLSNHNKTLHIKVTKRKDRVYTSCPLGRLYVVADDESERGHLTHKMKMDIAFRIQNFADSKHEVPFWNHKRVKLKSPFCKHEQVVVANRKPWSFSQGKQIVFDLGCLELSYFNKPYNLPESTLTNQNETIPNKGNIYYATSDPFNCFVGQHRSRRQIDDFSSSNKAPRLLYNLTHFNATFCNIFSYDIPVDLFYDEEDGFTHNLTVSLLSMNGSKLSKESWVQITSHTIIGAVTVDFARYNLGRVFHYQIVASDTSGQSAVAILHIQLPDRLPKIFYQVNVKVTRFFPEDHPYVYDKLLTALKLAIYFGDSWFGKINLISFHHDETSNLITLGWTNCTLVQETCPWQAIRYLSSKLKLANGSINPKFVAEMRPQYEVYNVTEMLLLDCQVFNSSSTYATVLPSPTQTAPIILGILPPLNASTDEMFDYIIPNSTFYDYIDGYTNTLTLQLQTLGMSDVPPSSWIQYDASRQALIGVLQVNTLQGSESALFQYVLVASNSRGYKTGMNVTIRGKSTGFKAGLVLTFTGSLSSESANTQVDLFVLLRILNRLRYYLRDIIIWRIEVNSFVKIVSGQDVRFFLQWASTTFTTTSCPDSSLRKFLQSLQLPDGEVNPELSKAMSSVIDLESILTSRHGKCNPDVSSSPSTNVRQTPNPLEPPRIMITLSRLNITASVHFIYVIPNNLFLDSLDGYTRNLLLDLRTSNGKSPVGQSSWIQLNINTQTLHAFLTRSTLQGQLYSIFTYTLVATNSRGVETSYNLTIYASVRKTFFGIKITFTGSEYNSTSWNNVRFLQYVVTRLSSYLGSDYQNSIEVIQVQRTFNPLWQFSLSWTIAKTGIETCDEIPKNQLKSLLFSEDLAINPDLRLALSPYVVFTQVKIQDAGPCVVSSRRTSPPLPSTPIVSPTTTATPIPVQVSTFPNLTAFTNEYFYYLIPEDMFYDPIDGKTRNLKIEMYAVDLKEIHSSSWIQFDSKTQTMYGFLNTKLFVSSHALTFTYILAVSNSVNYQSKFTISIRGFLYPLSPGMEVSMNLRIFLSTSYPDVWIVRQVIFRTRFYLKEALNNTIQIVSWTRMNLPYHEIRLVWASTRISFNNCNFLLLRDIQQALLHSSGQVSTNYMIALAPYFVVIDIVLRRFGSCTHMSTVEFGTQRVTDSTTITYDGPSIYTKPSLSENILAGTPTPVYYPPKVNTTVPPITVEFCKFLYYQIPKNTFKAGNMNTRSLSLELFDDKLSPLLTSSWIQFNPSIQVVYGFLKVSDYQIKDLLPKHYVLIATNAVGQKGKTNISFLLPSTEFLRSYEVTLVTDKYYDLNSPDVNEQLLLLSKISTYLGNFITDSIQLISFEASADQKSLTTTWTNCSLPNHPCPRDDIQRMSDMLLAKPGVPQRSFIDALKPQYTLKGLHEQILGSCLVSELSPITSSEALKRYSTFSRPSHIVSSTASFATKVNMFSNTLLTPKPSLVKTDTLQSSVYVNYPPVAINVLLRVKAEVCIPLYYKISEYAFYDIEDGFTRNLRLSLRKEDGSSLDQISWLQFDRISQTVYGIVVQSDLTSVTGEEEYLLIAEDKHGLKATHILKVLLPALTFDPNNVVYMDLELVSSQNQLNVDIKIRILRLLVNYISDSNNSSISFISFRRIDSNTATISLTWTNCTLSTESCDRQGIEVLRNKLLKEDNTINPELLIAMSSAFKVKQVTFNLKGSCTDNSTVAIPATPFATSLKYVLTTTTPSLKNHPPVMRKLLPVLNATMCDLFKYKIDEEFIFDLEDRDISKLQFYLTEENGSMLKRSSWIQLNASILTMYGVLRDDVFQDSHSITQKYRLVAVDSGGLSTFQIFTVICTRRETKENYVVTFHLLYYMSSLQTDTYIVQDLISKIITYIGIGNIYDVRVIELSREAGDPEKLTFKWSNCSLPTGHCPRDVLTHLQSMLLSTAGLVNTDLVLAFAPGYLVTRAIIKEPEECLFPSSASSEFTHFKASSTVPYKINLASSTSILQSSVIADLPPLVASKILPLSASFCRPFSYQVPEDLFYDREDGNTRQLMLTLLWQNGTALPRDSWIQLSQSSQTIYGILKVSDFENKPENGYHFTLVATDSKGQSASTNFNIRIPLFPPLVNHKITLTLNRFFTSTVPDVDEELLLLTKISKYVGDQDTQKINVILFSRVIVQGNITIVWSNCSFSYQPCPIKEVEKLFNLFSSNNDETDDSFKSVLLPQYTNSTVHTEKLGPCLTHLPTIYPTVSPTESFIYNRPPRARVQVIRLNVTFCSVFEYTISDDLFTDEDGPTSHLSLSLIYLDGTALKNDSWILFNKANRTIYGIFKSSDVEISPWRSFKLTATDSQGTSGFTSLSLNVPTKTRKNTHSVNIRAISYESSLIPDLDVLIVFRSNLLKLYGDENGRITFNSFVRLQENSQVGYTISYTNCTLEEDICTSDAVQELTNKIFALPEILNPKFILAFAPNLVMQSASVSINVECDSTKLLSPTPLSPTSSISTDAFPVVVRKIPPLNVSLCSIFQYKIMSDSFYDQEDGYADKLHLVLENTDGKELEKDSWITLNQKEMLLKGILKRSDTLSSRTIQYRLKATDSTGKSTWQIISFRLTDRGRSIGYEIKTWALTPLLSSTPSYEILAEFQSKLGDYLSSPFDKQIQIISYRETNINPLHFEIRWSLCLLDENPCNHTLLDVLHKKLFQAPNVLTVPYLIALIPNVRVINTFLYINNTCTQPTINITYSSITTSMRTEIPSRIISTTSYINSPPKLGRPVPKLVINYCEPLIYELPADTCVDNEDGNIMNLLVYLTFTNGSSLPGDFWVQVKKNETGSWLLRGILMHSHLNEFVNNSVHLNLVCQDSRGRRNSHLVEISTALSDTTNSNVVAVLSYLFVASNLDKLDIQFLWVQKLNSYLKRPPQEFVVFHSFLIVPSVQRLAVFQFSDCSLRQQCHLIEQMRSSYLGPQETINNSLLLATIPEFVLVAVQYNVSATCLSIESSPLSLATPSIESITLIPWPAISRTISIESVSEKSRYLTEIQKFSMTFTMSNRYDKSTFVTASPSEIPSISVLIPAHKINVSSCKEFSYLIPDQTFYDSKFGYTKNLSLQLLTEENKVIDNSSWIQLDSTLQRVYGIVNIEDFKLDRKKIFVIRALTLQGSMASSVLEVEIVPPFSIPSHEFQTESYVYSNSMEQVSLKGLITDKLMAFNGNRETDGIQFRSFSYVSGMRNRISFVWSSCHLLSSCTQDSLRSYQEKFLLFGTLLSGTFVSALLPELLITKMRGVNNNCGISHTIGPSTMSIQSRANLLSTQLTVLPSVTVLTSEAINNIPRVLNPIAPIRVFLCSQLSYRIPENTFIDLEDGNTRQLKLSLLSSSGTKLSQSSWVQFVQSTQVLYGLLKVSDIDYSASATIFQLVAADRRGSTAILYFQFIFPAVPITNFVVESKMERYFELSTPDITSQFYLLAQIGNYFQDVSIENILLIAFHRSSSSTEVTALWTNCTLLQRPCPTKDVLNVADKLLLKNGKINAKFSNALQPFQLNSVKVTLNSSCPHNISYLPTTSIVSSLAYSLTVPGTPPAASTTGQSSSVYHLVSAPNTWRSTPSSTIPVLKYPKVVRAIENLTVSACESFSFQIPSDTFSDDTDGSTRKLRLELRLGNNKLLSRSYWLQFSPELQLLYGILKLSDLNPFSVTSFDYQLLATNSLGLTTPLKIYIIVPTTPKLTNFIISLTVSKYFTQSVVLFHELFSIREKIYDYFRGKSLTPILFVSANCTNSIVNVEISQCTIVDDGCNQILINQARNLVLSENGAVNSALRTALLPQYTIFKVAFQVVSSCRAESLFSLYSIRPFTSSDLSGAAGGQTATVIFSSTANFLSRAELRLSTSSNLMPPQSAYSTSSSNVGMMSLHYTSAGIFKTVPTESISYAFTETRSEMVISESLVSQMLTKSSTAIAHTSSVTSRRGPILNKTIYINASYCSSVEYYVARNIFDIKEAANNNSLHLNLKYLNGSKLGCESWVHFDNNTNLIYGRPLASQRPGVYLFLLTAFDKAGFATNISVEIHLLSDTKPNTTYRIITSLVFNLDEGVCNSYALYILSHKIQRYLGYVNISFELLARAKAPSPSVTAFAFCNLRVNPCNFIVIQSYYEKIFAGPFLGESKTPSPNLIAALVPEFTVVLVLDQRLGQCEVNKVLDVVMPLKTINVSMCGVMNYTIPAETFYDYEDGNTRNLRLQLTLMTLEPIPQTSWLQFDPSRQTVYGIPTHEVLKSQSEEGYNYRLTAYDVAGAKAATLLKVRITDAVPKSECYYENVFHCVVINRTIDTVLRILRSIARQDVNNFPLNFNLISYQQFNNSLRINWTYCSSYCLDVTYNNKLYNSCWSPNKTIHPTRGPSIPHGNRTLALNISTCNSFTFSLKDFFNDQRGVIKLYLVDIEGKNVENKSWIYVDQERQKLSVYATLTTLLYQPSEGYIFRLIAEYAIGTVQQVNISLKVYGSSRVPSYNVTMKLQWKACQSLVYMLEEFRKIMKDFLNLTASEDIKLLNANLEDTDHCLVSISWTLCDFPSEYCDYDKLSKIRKGLGVINVTSGKYNIQIGNRFLTLISVAENLHDSCQNTKPIAIQAFLTFNLSLCQNTSYPIKEDMFMDKEQGSTSNLRLSVHPKVDWISLSDKPTLIKFTPVADFIEAFVRSNKTIVITASDKWNLTANLRLQIILPNYSKLQNFIFKIKFISYVNIKGTLTDIDEILQFKEALMKYLGMPSNAGIVLNYKIIGTYPRFVNTTISFCSLLVYECNRTLVHEATKMMMETSGTPRVELILALTPSFVVTTVESELKGSCINRPPLANVSHLRLEASFCSHIQYSIPEGLFLDPESYEILQYQLLETSGQKIEQNSWIQFDKKSNTIYGTPVLQEILKQPNHTYKYLLRATDKDGGFSNITVHISINVKTNNYSHQVTLIFSDTLKATIPENRVLTLLLYKIASFFGSTNETVAPLLFFRDIDTSGVSIFTFANCTSSTDTCDHQSLDKLNAAITNNAGSPTSSFINHLSPEFILRSVLQEKTGACKTPSQTSPVVMKPFKQFNLTLCTMIEEKIPEDTFYDKEDGSASNLFLYLQLADGSFPPRSSLIQFDIQNKMLYIVPSMSSTQPESSKVEKARLYARDKDGNTVWTPIDFRILNSTAPNYIFVIDTIVSDSTRKTDVEILRSFSTKMVEYLNSTSTRVERVAIQGYNRMDPSFKLNISICDLPRNYCDLNTISNISLQLMEGGILSNRFARSMNPEFNITSIEGVPNGNCIKGNTPPYPNVSIPLIPLSYCHFFYQQIPNNTFLDSEDGDIWNLKLKLLFECRDPVTASSPLQYDTEKKTLYADISYLFSIQKPEGKVLKYCLVAVDSSGMEANITIYTRLPERQLDLNYLYTTVVRSYETSKISLLRSLLAKLNMYLGEKSQLAITRLVVSEQFPQLVNFEWSNCSWSNVTCNKEAIKKTNELLLHDNTQLINPYFVQAMAPQFVVMSVRGKAVGACNITTNAAPIVNKNVTVLLGYCQKLRYIISSDTFSDKEDGTNLSLILTTLNRNDSLCISNVVLNSTTQTLYNVIYSSDSQQQQKMFVKAIDSQGLHALAPLTVYQSKMPRSIPYQITLMINSQLNTDICEEFFIKSLAIKLSAYSSVSDLIFTSFSRDNSSGNIQLSFSRCKIANLTCLNDDVYSFKDLFFSDSGIKNAFREALTPEYTIEEIQETKLIKCTSYSLSTTSVSVAQTKLSTIFQPTRSHTSLITASLVPLCNDFNTVPILVNTLTQIEAISGKPEEYQIPLDLAYDKEDGHAHYLSFTLLDSSRRLVNDTWVYLNKTTRRLYVVAVEEEKVLINDVTYSLRIQDNCGADVYDSFVIKIVNQVSCCNLISVELNGTKDNFLRSAYERTLFYDKLTNFYGNTGSTLRIYSILREPTKESTIVFFSSNSTDTECLASELKELSQPVLNENREIKKEFLDLFSVPGILSVHVHNDTFCNRSVPVVPPFIPPIAATVRSDLNWLYWLLPFLVIAALLLLCCILYYCCKKCEVSQGKMFVHDTQAMAAPAFKDPNLESVGAFAAVEASAAAAAIVPLHFDKEDPEEENPYAAIDSLEHNQVPRFIPSSGSQRLQNYPTAKPLWAADTKPVEEMFGAAPRNPPDVNPEKEFTEIAPIPPQDIEDTIIPVTRTNQLESMPFFSGEFEETDLQSAFLSETVSRMNQTTSLDKTDVLRNVEMQTDPQNNSGLRLPGLPSGPPPPYSPPRPPGRYQKLPTYEDATSETTASDRRSKGRVPIVATVPVQFKTVAHPRNQRAPRRPRRKSLVLLKNRGKSVRPTHLSIDRELPEKLKDRKPLRRLALTRSQGRNITTGQQRPHATQDLYPDNTVQQTSRLMPSFVDTPAPLIRPAGSVILPADRGMSPFYGYNQQPYVVGAMPLQYTYAPEVVPRISSSSLMYSQSPLSFFHDPLIEDSVLEYPHYRRSFRYSPYSGRRLPTSLYQRRYTVPSSIRRGLHSPYFGRRTRSQYPHSDDFYLPFDREGRSHKAMEGKGRYGAKNKRGRSWVRHTLDEADRQIETGSARRSVNRSSDLEDSDEMTERIKTWLRESQYRRPAEEGTVGTEAAAKRERSLASNSSNAHGSSAERRIGKRAGFQTKKKRPSFNRRRATSFFSRFGNRGDGARYQHPLSDLTEVSETKVSGSTGNGIPLQDFKNSKSAINKSNDSRRFKLQDKHRTRDNLIRDYSKLFESHNEDSL